MSDSSFDVHDDILEKSAQNLALAAIKSHNDMLFAEKKDKEILKMIADNQKQLRELDEKQADRFGERILNKEISGRYGNAKIEGSEVIMYEGSKCCIVTANGIVKFEGDIKTEALEIFKASGLNRYYVMSADELRVIYLTK